MDILQNSVTFFFNFELLYTNYKTGPNKSRNMKNTILSLRVIIW